MRPAGLDYAGPIHADGQLHRFKADGDKARNSWYVLHAGPPAAGAFGCWRRGFKDTWHGGKTDLTQAQWETVRRQWREAEAAREHAEAKRQAEARRVAAWIMHRAKPADPAHGYLAAKAVKPAGQLIEYRHALALPLCDAAGTLHSLQFISADGTKRFLTGARVAACFFTLADKADGPLVICEGFATAASISEVTSFSTVAAMNCGNLPAVAVALRAKWPAREFILAADNDAWTPGNPGLSKATEAAKATGGKLGVPSFPDTASKPTDFNDLARIEGRAEVLRQIKAAASPTETDEEKLHRLAALSPIEFDRAADKEASAMGVNVGTLRAEVAKRRGKASDNAQGSAVELPDVEPWPDPVDGAEVLSAVATRFLLYVALPPGAADALALWVALAHAFEAFIHSPRLNLHSPEKQCGKTLTLDVIASLVPRALRSESMSVAVLFRVVDAHKPTLLLDETDAYLTNNEELRGLLNAGHKRGARAYRCEGDSNNVRGYNAFAPVVLAGIGNLPGTLHDRSIIIRLVRAKPSEITARFDSRYVAPETELCRKLARWTADNFARLETADPVLPEGAFNRLADNWRPLFAIADAAGADWPARAAVAFAALTGSEDTDAQGIGATLLADIAAAFAEAGADKLPSAELAKALASIEGRPWAEYGKAAKPISPNQVAKQLKRFSISPRTIKLDTGSIAKGYHLADFNEAFARFLQKPEFPKRNPVTTPENIGDSPLSETSPPQNGLRFEKAAKPNETGLGYAGYASNTPGPQKEAIIL